MSKPKINWMCLKDSWLNPLFFFQFVLSLIFYCHCLWDNWESNLMFSKYSQDCSACRISSQCNGDHSKRKHNFFYWLTEKYCNYNLWWKLRLNTFLSIAARFYANSLLKGLINSQQENQPSILHNIYFVGEMNANIWRTFWTRFFFFVVTSAAVCSCRS